MGDLTINIHGKDLPLAQVMELAELIEKYPDGTWHYADCGCCICFHPVKGEGSGYLIGSDGGKEYHQID